jgi:hypothetical protein
MALPSDITVLKPDLCSCSPHKNSSQELVGVDPAAAIERSASNYVVSIKGYSDSPKLQITDDADAAPRPLVDRCCGHPQSSVVVKANTESPLPLTNRPCGILKSLKVEGKVSNVCSPDIKNHLAFETISNGSKALDRRC